MTSQMTDLTRSEDELALIPDYAAGNCHGVGGPGCSWGTEDCRLKRPTECMAELAWLPTDASRSVSSYFGCSANGQADLSQAG